MGHRHWMMPAGGRLPASAAHWQSAEPFSGKPAHRDRRGKLFLEKKARRTWYAASPLILLLSVILWAMTAGGIAAVVRILSS